jgi:hypothetical protein
MLDSGAERSHTKHLELLKQVDNITHLSRTADGSAIESKAKGNIGIFNDLLFTPQFNDNLFSVAQLVDSGFNVIFGKEKSFIINSSLVKSSFERFSKLTTELHRERNVWYADYKDLAELKNLEKVSVVSTNPIQTLTTWHQRLHLSDDLIIKLFKKNYVDGLSLIDEESKGHLSVCETCCFTKIRKNNYHKRNKIPVPKRYWSKSILTLKL